MVVLVLPSDIMSALHLVRGRRLTNMVNRLVIFWNPRIFDTKNFTEFVHLLYYFYELSQLLPLKNHVMSLSIQMKQ